MNLQAKLTSLALLGAQWVMWLLVALSVAALAVIVERAIFFVTSRDAIGVGTNKLLEQLRRGDFDGARAHLETSPSFEARIAVAALTLGGERSGSHGAEEGVAAERINAKLEMERRLAFLGTLGNNAPFVGLLGTVIGIISAFRELAASSGQVSAGLMAEIGEALVVTGLGLVVALPAVAAFNFFQQVIARRIERGEALSQEILSHLKSHEQRLVLAGGSVPKGDR